MSYEILQKVERIEQTLTKGLKQVEEKLTTGQSLFQLFNDGLSAYKVNLLKDNNITTRSLWLEKIRADTDLRYPHRKILDFLLVEYDFSNKEFKEVHFSRLANEAHLGKNMLNAYLALLEQKGYIKSRDDGYRKYVRINQ